MQVGRILCAIAAAGTSGRFAALAGLALVAGCATRGGDIPYEPAGFGAPDALTRNALPQDLPLGPLDQIKVTVFRVPDLSGDYTVGGDGTVVMPLIGKIDARDKTPDQLAGDLRAAYGTRYLNDPQVTVRVVQSNQRNVVVEGGVRSAGIFPLAGKTTLVGAVALASGIDNDNGNPRRVAIFRRIGGKTMAAAFDLIDIRRGKMIDPDVYPGDTVVVDGNSTRQLYRDIIQSIPTAAVFTSF